MNKEQLAEKEIIMSIIEMLYEDKLKEIEE
jgi:hypothetical protein